MKLVISILFISFFVPNLYAQRSHPFMVVSKKDFSELREKSNKEPFKVMKMNALKGFDDDFEDDDWNKMALLLSQNTLLYALDESEEKKKYYRTKILSIISRWEGLESKLGYDHQSTVYSAGALFNSILALDMIYNDLSENELILANSNLESVYQWFLRDRMKDGNIIWWSLCRLGVLATYNIYMQDNENAKLWSERYRYHLLEISINPDGTWVQSPGYAQARIAGDRIAKSNPIDIIQASRIFNFYEDPKMIGFLDWLNTFATTPFKTSSKFGETGLNKPHKIEGKMIGFISNRYSKKAAKNAAWHNQGQDLNQTNFSNCFINYCLGSEENFVPEIPVSLLKEYTGAALWGRDNGTESLQGILYSVKRNNWDQGGFHHTSEDVNSIGINAYGEYMISNAGTNYKPSYPGETPDGGRWYEAWMQNVVLIGNSTRHEIKGEGGGLIDGIVGTGIEFGTTDSRGVLDHATHQRSLIMVHEERPRNNGYFIIADKVKLSFVKKNANILLQPNTRFNSLKEVEKNTEYWAPINGFVQDNWDGSEAISIYYGIEPIEVEKSKAWKGAYIEEDFENDRLVAKYKANEFGVVNALTVLFPQDKSHAKADFERINGIFCEGVKVKHADGNHDIILSSDGEQESTYNDLKFKAKTSVFKYDKGQVSSLLLIEAFKYKSAKKFQFKANNPVSLYLNNYKGTLNLNRSTTIEFNTRLKVSIYLNGTKLKRSKKTKQSALFKLPKGSYHLELK